MDSDMSPFVDVSDDQINDLKDILNNINRIELDGDIFREIVSKDFNNDEYFDKLSNSDFVLEKGLSSKKSDADPVVLIYDRESFKSYYLDFNNYTIEIIAYPKYKYHEYMARLEKKRYEDLMSLDQRQAEGRLLRKEKKTKVKSFSDIIEDELFGNDDWE